MRCVHSSDVYIPVAAPSILSAGVNFKDRTITSARSAASVSAPSAARGPGTLRIYRVCRWPQSAEQSVCATGRSGGEVQRGSIATVGISRTALSAEL